MPPLIFTSAAQFAAVNAVLVLAQVIYVAFGFGSGLIAVGILALMFPSLQDVVVLLLLVNLPAEILVVARSWREIRWRHSSTIAAGIVVGVPLGTYVLKTGSPGVVLTGLGIFLVAVSGVLLRLRDGARVAWPRWSGPPVGLTAGVLTGLFGTGGPPLIIYHHLAGLGKGAFRGNLMALFLLQTCLRIPTYAAGGLLTVPRIWSGLMLVPAALLGTWAGQRLHVQLSEQAFRRLVSLLLGMIGLLLLVKQIR